jgi:AAA domain
MSLFKKPAIADRRLKIYIYGDTGVGKTVTALSFPKPAVVDLENGTTFYAGPFDFDKIQTTDLNEAVKAIDELITDPQGYKTFVLDSLTVYYDILQDNYLRKLRVKKAKPDYTFQPSDYKVIKADVRTLINKMLALDMNVVVTARSKNKYSQDAGEFMKVIGTQPDGPAEAPPLFDVVLEITMDQEGARTARVVKDRTNRLPQRFEFTYQELTKYLDMKELEREPVQLRSMQALNKTAKRTTKVKFQDEELLTAGVTAETLGELSTILDKLTEEELTDKLKEDYFVSSILDLHEDEARQLFADISGKLTTQGQ